MTDVLYRDYRGDGSLVLVMPQRIVSEDERGLLTWRPIGTPYLFRRTVDGRDRREIPFHERHTVDWELAPLTWNGRHVLHLFRPGRAHSVWWMFHPAYWTAEQAAGIRAEGERVIADVEAARFPFDGSWLDFRPDPAWPVPALPAAAGVTG